MRGTEIGREKEGGIDEMADRHGTGRSAEIERERKRHDDTNGHKDG